MSYETLIWEQSGGSGRLTLNRPDSLNSWTTELGHELRQVLEGEAADASVRAVMITGAGRGFSSGADLKSGFEPHPDDGRPNLRKELDEIYHPAAHRFRFEIEVHEQRMMPMPSADDQRKRSRGEVEQSGTNRRATEPQRRRGGIDDSDE